MSLEAPQGPSPELKAKILQLIHEHNTEEALLCCQGLGEPYLLLQAQFNAAKNHGGNDLIAAEYFEATKSRINFALQELMAQKTMPVPQESSFFNSIRKFFS